MKQAGTVGVTVKEKIMQDYLDSLLQSATENLLEEEAEQQQGDVIISKQSPSELNSTAIECENFQQSTTAAESNTSGKLSDSDNSLQNEIIASENDSKAKGAESENEQSSEFFISDFSAKPWLNNGKPYWAQSRFESLMFKVYGLKLAAPLIEMGTIVKVEQQLTPIFAQPEWFLGLLSHAGRNIKVVDIAKLVMPERYQEEAKDNIHFIITMAGTDWGMAIHDVLHAITLEPDEIHWKGKRGKRPWLAGTVVDEMCALMDVGHLAERLVQEQRHFNEKQ